MTRETLEMAKDAYIKSLQEKQTYYGINDHDLGQAKKWISSFTNYIDYLMANKIEGTKTTRKEEK